MKSARVQWVIVGADRIAANGDTANKIGTYQLAIAARHHGVKFMVVAPSSTIDMATPDGARDRHRIALAGRIAVVRRHAHRGRTARSAWNPVFDVTPARADRRDRHRTRRHREAGCRAHEGAVRRERTSASRRRLTSRPRTRRMALRKQILLFAIGGLIGFVVDAGIVQFLVRECGMRIPTSARLVSFLAPRRRPGGFNRQVHVRAVAVATAAVSASWSATSIGDGAAVSRLNYGDLRGLVASWLARSASLAGDRGRGGFASPGGLVNFISSQATGCFRGSERHCRLIRSSLPKAPPSAT